LTQLIACFEDIPLKNKNYCDNKFLLGKENVANLVAECGDTLAVCTLNELQTNLKTCYETQALLTVD
jgi:hypothetical protein